METMIAEGKYKVIEVLRADEDYEAALCIDVVKNNDYAMNIVNTYKSKSLIRAFLPLYYGLSRETCSDFVSLITTEGGISAVFRYHEGEDFHDFFESHPTDAYEEKLAYADALLQLSLTLDLLDDRIACSALTGNVTVSAASKSIGFNYIVPPEIEPGESFRSRLLGDMLHEIFKWDLLLPTEIEKFADDLQDGRYQSCVEIYSAWRKLQEEAAKTRRGFAQESIFAKILRLIKHKRARMKRSRARNAG